MDTILNLGINVTTEAALAVDCRDVSFARDTHRRFIELYAHTVLKRTPSRSAAWTIRWAGGTRLPRPPASPSPTMSMSSCAGAVRAVFESWNSRRARRYRQHHAIAEESRHGCRRPGDGLRQSRRAFWYRCAFQPQPGDRRARRLSGEFLPRAQGEDLVSGKLTPLPLAAMRERLAEALDELLSTARLLEREHADVQDIEFTVERGRLYLLQTRSASARRWPR